MERIDRGSQINCFMVYTEGPRGSVGAHDLKADSINGLGFL